MVEQLTLNARLQTASKRSSLQHAASTKLKDLLAARLCCEMHKNAE
jgi:hypothetical protein